MGNGHHKDHYLGICALIIQQIRRDLISAFCRFVRVNDEIDRANGIALRLLREGRQKASVKSISFWAEKTVDVSRQLNAIEQLPQDRRAATTMVLVREQGRVYLSKLYCLEFGKLLAKRRTQLVELYGFGCIRDEDSVTNDAAPPGPAMNKQCRGVPTDRPCITSARTHPRRSRLCTTRVHGSSSIRHGGDPARSGRAHTCQVQYKGRRRTQLHSAYSIVETSYASPTSVDHRERCARSSCLHVANLNEDIVYLVKKALSCPC
jgi:hypothetical protein